MITIEDVIKKVSKNTGVDKETVEIICRHPFLCTVESMKDDNETKDILFNELFKFKLKKRFKENKTKQYSSR